MNDGTQITLNGISIEPEDRKTALSNPSLDNDDKKTMAAEREFQMETVNGIYMFLS